MCRLMVKRNGNILLNSNSALDKCGIDVRLAINVL